MSLSLSQLLGNSFQPQVHSPKASSLLFCSESANSSNKEKSEIIGTLKNQKGKTEH